MSSHTQGRILKRADPTTIQDKFLVGYQGWYTCPRDGEPAGPGHHGWLHWFNKPIPSGGHPNTDLWPDVSFYSASELFPAPGLNTQSGDPVFLFSSRNPKTVQRHFHWMAEHGVDGAFLQRFASECDVEFGNEGIRRIRDEVGDRVLEAAEKEGRVFAIMYDVTSVPADRIHSVLAQDWTHLMHNKKILDSPNYLREKGRPVVGLWGFGFEGAGHTPAMLRFITHFFRSYTPGGSGGVYLVGGTPTNWRTCDGDADRDPGFREVWLREFDAIMPWTVGRYKDGDEGGNEGDGQRAREKRVEADINAIGKWVHGSGHQREYVREVAYVPVVYPGGSGFNLSEGKWGFNDIKRNQGRFLWSQIVHANKMAVKFVYGAMWDEYDEGTAFMPVVSNKQQLPFSDYFPFMALDVDGHNLPSDWYMRICGLAAEGLRKERSIQETFPYKELIDYWSSRPRYEVIDAVSSKSNFVSGGSASEHNSRPFVREGVGVGEGGSGGSGGGEDEGGTVGQTYQEWLATQTEDGNDVAPPPYSLEAEEVPLSVTQRQADVTIHVSTPALAIPNLPPRSSPAATASVPVASQENNHSVSAPHQASRPSPPAVNTSSRPQSEQQQQQSYSANGPSSHSHHSYAIGTPQSHSLGHGHGHVHIHQHHDTHEYGQGQQGYPQAQDRVNALANDFGRHGISSAPSQTKVHTQIPSQGSTLGRIQVSPPPLHPAHPAAAVPSISTSGSGHLQAFPPPLHPAHPAAAALSIPTPGAGHLQAFSPPPFPPPLHSAQAAAAAKSGCGSAASYSYNQRPHTSHARPTNSSLHLPSQSGSGFSPSHSPSGSPSHMPHTLPAGFAQPAMAGRPGQRPPAERRNDGAPGPGAATSCASQQQRPQSSCGSQNISANLTRPHTVTASSTSSSSSLRPHASTGSSTGRSAHDERRLQLHSPGPSGNVSTGRPYPTPSPGPGHGPGHVHRHGSGSVSPYPGQGSSTPSHGEHGATSFPANPGPTIYSSPEAMPSGYAGHNSTAHSGKVTSTQTPYTSQPTHGYKDNYLNTPVHTSHSPSGQANVRTPTPGPSPYPGKPYNPPYPDHGHNTIQGSFPGQLPHGGAPGSYGAPHSHGNISQPGGFHVPQGGTEYFNTPQPHAYIGPHHNSYSPAYIGPQSPAASYQPPLHHQASFPSPNTSAPGGWSSESSNSSVRPPMIPSPVTHTTLGPISGVAFPTASTGGGGAFGFALSAVDKVGKKTLVQLESGAGSFAQSSSKLLGKFTK